MRRPGSSIHRRFLRPFAAAMLGGTLMAWLLANWLYADALERRLTSQLSHAAEVLAEGRFPLTPELLDGLARLLRADIALYGDAGEPLVHTPTPEARGDIPMARVERALEPGRDARYRSLALTADLSDIRAAASSSALWLASGAALLLLALTWVGHRIGLTVARPVESLARMADAIAAGDRGVRVPVERADEVGALAASLNAMAERLERYEAELAEQSRLAALGAVSARIAHEIRNPLTAIKLQVQLLAESVTESERATALALEREIARLELVVSGILQQARPGPTILDRRPVDVAALTLELADLFRLQLAHRGIRLSLDCPDDLPLAQLDPERFKQVATNLLVNARDALPRGGEIRLGWAAAWDRLTFSVDDSGPGIEASAGPPTSAKPDGLGLGLRVSREIVEAHGGTLALGPGPLGGMRALATLPLELAPADAMGPSP